MSLKRCNVILASLVAAFLLGLAPAGAGETSYQGETMVWDIVSNAPGVTFDGCKESYYGDGDPAYICDYSSVYPFVYQPITLSLSITPAVYKEHVSSRLDFDGRADAWDETDWLRMNPAPNLGFSYDSIFMVWDTGSTPILRRANFIYRAYNYGPDGNPVDIFRLIVRVTLYLDEHTRAMLPYLRGGPEDWKDTDFCGRRPHPDDPRFERFRYFRNRV